MSLNVFQKVYVDDESTFAGATSDLSGGVQVQPAERIKLDGFVQQLVDNPTVREGWDDLGGAPTQGLKEVKFDLSVLLSGVSVTSSQATADGLSTLLAWITGGGTIPTNGTVGDGSNTSTTTKVYTSDTFSAGDLIMISGEVRRISAVSGTELTLEIPLSSAPANGTTIYGVEYHTVTPGSVSSLGVGIQAEDSEMKYLAKGAIAAGGIKVDAKNGDYAKLTISLEAADFERVSSFTAPTTSAPETGVIVGDGGAVVIYDGSTSVSLCPSDISVGLGLSHEWIPSAVGTNGKCGYEAVPAESSLEVTAYQDSTLSALEGMLEKEMPVVVQFGDEQGHVVGVYYPSAAISAAPVPADIGSIQGVKVSLKTTTGILFRA